MAPLKQLNKQTLPAMDRGLKTRSQQVLMKKEVFPKRKADESPLKRITVKRSFLGDCNSKENERTVSFTAAVAAKQALVAAKQAPVATIRETRSRSSSRGRKPLSSVNSIKPPIHPATKPTLKPTLKPTTSNGAVAVASKVKFQAANTAKDLSVQTSSAANCNKSAVVLKTTAVVGLLPRPVKTQVKTVKKQTETSELSTAKIPAKGRLSDPEKSDGSLYVSALEELNLDDGKDKSQKKKQRKPLPPGIVDFDQENIKEPNSVAIYAMEIFEYLKSRESNFKISDYISRQPDLNSSMRSLVVGWMVEVQENYELNHETLYLGVKLLDLYLSKVRVNKGQLQLIGSASLFVAAKYDERYPPVIDDMVYVCDGLYTSDELINMERELLKTVDFQLGIPLSYRFLRRYARCSKLQMPILTLARYILETSLLDYSTIRYSDSKLAAAALHLALIMKEGKGWTSTLEYYSGYKAEEFRDIMKLLNDVLHTKQGKQHAVKSKYAHEIFYRVSKIPLVNTSDL